MKKNTYFISLVICSFGTILFYSAIRNLTSNSNISNNNLKICVVVGIVNYQYVALHIYIYIYMYDAVIVTDD